MGTHTVVGNLYTLTLIYPIPNTNPTLTHLSHSLERSLKVVRVVMSVFRKINIDIRLYVPVFPVVSETYQE